MTITSLSNIQTYTGNGFVTPYFFPMYFLSNAHMFVTRITIATGARQLLVENVDYTIIGAGNVAGGELDLMGSASPLTALFQLEIKRTLPIIQTDDYHAHDTFPAETMEKDLDYLTMIDQQQDYRLGLVEAAIGGTSVTFTNIGTGIGLYSSSLGSNFRFKSIKAGAGVTVVDDGLGTVTLNNTSSPLTFPGPTDIFLRGDGAFIDTLQLGITSTGLKIFADSSAVSYLTFKDTSAANNEKYWFMRGNKSVFSFGTATDALVAGNSFLSVTRVGAAVSTTALGGRVLVNGALDDTVTALQVSGTGTFTTPIAIGSGGTGQNNAQLALNALSNVAAATPGWVITKVGANAVFAASGAAGAPLAATYVCISNDATLTGERALAVEATVVTLTDGGANSNVTIGLAANGVTNAKLAQAPTLTMKGNPTGGTANVIDMTVAQIRTMLNNANRTTVSTAYAATVTLDLSLYPNFDVIDWLIGTLTGPVTANVTNGFDRQIVRMRFTQDATGGRVLTPGANLVGSVTTPLATYVLTTTANKGDEIAGQWNGTSGKFELRSQNLGY